MPYLHNRLIRLIAMTKFQEIKKNLKLFNRDILLSPDHEHLGIQNTFIDHDSGKRRAVIVTNDKSRVDEIEKLASKYLNDLLFIVKHEHGKAEFSSDIFAGNGIKHLNAGGWGTLGGLFRAKDGNVYGVSNSHVIALKGKANKGDQILYAPNIMAGTLQDWYNLEAPPSINYIDAAIFKLDKEFTPKWLLLPASTNSYSTQMGVAVQKMGLTTKRTTGKVSGVNGEGYVTLDNERFFFSNVIHVLGDNNSDFNEPGDSGSLLLTNPGGYIVGIVFAKKNKECWALPFKSALKLIDRIA